MWKLHLHFSDDQSSSVINVLEQHLEKTAWMDRFGSQRDFRESPKAASSENSSEGNIQLLQRKTCAWLFWLHPSHTATPACAGGHREAAHTWLPAGSVTGRNGSRQQHTGVLLYSGQPRAGSPPQWMNRLVLRGLWGSITLLTTQDLRFIEVPMELLAVIKSQTNYFISTICWNWSEKSV